MPPGVDAAIKSARICRVAMEEMTLMLRAMVGPGLKNRLAADDCRQTICYVSSLG
jgi:hypothetical protein